MLEFTLSLMVLFGMFAAAVWSIRPATESGFWRVVNCLSFATFYFALLNTMTGGTLYRQIFSDPFIGGLGVSSFLGWGIITSLAVVRIVKHSERKK